MLRFSRRSIFVIFSVVLITISGPSFTHAVQRPATQADVDGWMRYTGIPNPRVGMLVDSADPNIGQAAGEAKRWLAQHAAKSVIISCMDPVFVEKLKQFMEAVPGGIPIVTDGYRDPRKQTALVASGASKAGPCQSYHNYGLAADFNSRANIPWMRANSRNFGINTIGAWDPGHFQDARGRFGQCGACSGGPGGMLTDVPGGAPSGGLAQSLREAFYGPQQQPTLPPQPLPPAQPGTTQPGQYFNQPGQTGTPISIGTAVGGTASGSTSPLLDTSYDAPSDTGSGKPSIADQLLSIAYGTSSAIGTATTTAHAVPLTVNGTDVTQLQSGKHATSMLPESESGVIPLYPQNTFMAQDMSWQKDFSGSASQGQFLAILQELRDSLLKILASLRPMGITNSIEGGPSSAEAYLE